jgi:N-glycosidase YbiA
MTGVVYFYRVADAYGSFSNFSRHPVEIDGRTWPTAEHYFQAQKFHDPGIRARIALLDSPKEAARTGRDPSLPLRSDGETVKDDVMRTAIWAKVRQHQDVRALLLGTGTALIVEHTNKDPYWGDGGDGSGRNVLGLILVEVRATLLDQASRP